MIEITVILLSVCLYVATIVPDDMIKSIDHIIGKSGLLCADMEGKIIDVTTGVDLPSITEGEILVRGVNVMKGYLNNETATKETIDSEGWLHTGDIGYFDAEGHLCVTDRKKELIKYKGYQIAPADLEAVINSMDQVKDCIVIPVKDQIDENNGEVPRAYIVRQEAAVLNENDVMEYVKDKVTHYKQLRGGVKFVSQIPKSASGKLLRRIQIEIDRGVRPPL